MLRRLIVGSLAGVALLLAGCGASADVVATYRVGGGVRIVEAAASGWGRVEDRSGGAPLEEYELITPAGHILVVFRLNGRWHVADSHDRFAWRLRPPRRPKSPPPEGVFVSTGEEKVGAWSGTGYTMRAQGGTGRPTNCGSWTHIVVMHGPGLEAFGRVLRNNLRYALGGQGAPPCHFHAVDLIGQGVVLSLDDPPTTLERLDRRTIDPARFRLPSRLLTRAELFALLDAAYPEAPPGPPMAPPPRPAAAPPPT